MGAILEHTFRFAAALIVATAATLPLSGCRGVRGSAAASGDPTGASVPTATSSAPLVLLGPERSAGQLAVSFVP